jgi:hypothetical protein
MTETKETNATQKDSLLKPIGRYLAFVGMFVGAGFIAGSIVHLGEGINTWDVSLLIVGILFFLTSTCVQEFVFNKKNIKDAEVLQFIVYSIVLALGAGMASGGIQHFVDTPKYSSYLVPIGLGLGVIAFFLKERVQLTSKIWLQISGGVIALVLATIWILGEIGKVLTESLLHTDGHAHGLHSH